MVQHYFKNKWIFLGILFIFVWGFLIYGNVLNAPFQFDDHVFIVKNDNIKNIDRPLALWNNTTMRKRCIVFFTFLLNYHINKLDLFGYHLVNLIIHLFVVCSIWWFVTIIYSFRDKKSETRDSLAAYGVALLFLTHPIQTQAVSYISQRFTSLSALFYILSVCFYILGRRCVLQKASLIQTSLSFSAVFIFVLLGFFTKESFFTLPLALCLTELIFFPGKQVRKTLIFLVLGFLVVFVGLILFQFNISLLLSRLSYMGTTSWAYLMTQFKVIWLYIGLLFFPFFQSIDHQVAIAHSFWRLSVIVPFLGLLGIMSYALMSLKRNKFIAFGIGWFFVTLLIESSIFPIEDAMVEHRMYLPSIGIFIVFIEWIRLKKFGKRLFIIICILFSVLTVKRNMLWNDEIAIWKDVVKKSPKNIRALHNIGFQYYKKRKYDEAIKYFDKVIQMNPRHFLAYMNRANIHKFQGRYGRAFLDYEIAERIRPNHPETFYNRGNLYFRLKKYDKALKDYGKAVRLKETYVKAYFMMGNLHKKLGQYDKALKNYKRALLYRPDWSVVYNNRGNIFSDQGKDGQAIEEFSKAIQLNPRLTDAYNNRGVVYASKNENQKALQDYNMAIKLSPNFAEAYYNRGNLYVILKKYDLALKDYTNALLNKVFPQVLFKRGITYQEIGENALAIKDYNKFLELYGNNPEIKARRDSLLHKGNGVLFDSIRDL